MFGPKRKLNSLESPGFNTICPLVKSIPEYLKIFEPSDTSYAQIEGLVQLIAVMSEPVFSASIRIVNIGCPVGVISTFSSFYLNFM